MTCGNTSSNFNRFFSNTDNHQKPGCRLYDALRIVADDRGLDTKRRW